jgi:hypothetical protein
VEWRAVDVEPRCVIVGLTPHALLLFVTFAVPERCEVAPNEPASLSPLSPHQYPNNGAVNCQFAAKPSHTRLKLCQQSK